jgi:DNA replication protein DnaC
LLTHPTLDQLHQLGLAGMARAFTELEANPQSAELSHAEWLALLLDREATERYQRRLRARLRYARLRHQASVEDVDYRAARGLDRSLFQAPIAGRWIEEAELDHRRTSRGRQKLACLCSGSKGLSGQPLGALSAHTADVRRSGIGPR